MPATTPMTATISQTMRMGPRFLVKTFQPRRMATDDAFILDHDRPLGLRAEKTDHDRKQEDHTDEYTEHREKCEDDRGSGSKE